MKKVLGLTLAVSACVAASVCAQAVGLDGVDDFNDYIVAPGSIIDLEIDGDFNEKINQRGQMRVKMDYDHGKSLVKSASIHRDADGDYYVRIRLEEADVLTPKELQATVTVTSSGNSVEGYIDTLVGYQETYADPDDRSVSLTVKNSSPVIVFDEYNTSASLSVLDEALFTVKLTGQDPVNMKYNTDMVKEVEMAHEYAGLRYLTFEAKPVFDYVGTMKIYASKGSYLYQYDGQRLSRIDAAYSDGALSFRTDTLGCYVISDRALNGAGSVIAQPEEEKPAEGGSVSSGGSAPSGGKVNPETGVQTVAALSAVVSAVAAR